MSSDSYPIIDMNDENAKEDEKNISSAITYNRGSRSTLTTNTSNNRLSVGKILNHCLTTRDRVHHLSPPVKDFKQHSISAAYGKGNDEDQTRTRTNNNDHYHRYYHGKETNKDPPRSASNYFLSPSTHEQIYSLQEEREQALRDYKVTIEYKHLKSHAPGGVYLIPSMHSLREFYGTIFVRRGPFTNGIFKFKLTLPLKYNDTDMWPRIVFSSRVYNPYVNEQTGQLDIQSAYPSWDPSRHYLVTVLTYLKKVFYSKNFVDAKANTEAKALAETDPKAYRKKVELCVHESQKNVYINEDGSTAKFTEEAVAHRVLRDLLKHHIQNENQVTKQVSDWIDYHRKLATAIQILVALRIISITITMHHVSYCLCLFRSMSIKQAVLTQIEKARKV